LFVLLWFYFFASYLFRISKFVFRISYLPEYLFRISNFFEH